MFFPLAFGFVAGLGGSSTLFLNSLIRPLFDGQDRVSHGPESDESVLGDLGRRFLFKDSKLIFGIPAVRDPATQVQTIPASHRSAIDSIVNRLRLFGQIKTMNVTPPPNGSVMLLGGPVANRYSRLVLGDGTGSPLLGVVGAEHAIPVSFSTSDRATSGARHVQTSKSDWHLLVQGRRITEPQEFLLIHSMPNPYSPTPERLVVIGGRHGHGTEAIEIVLRDRRLLEGLLTDTNDLPAWQALIPVMVENQRPIAVGEYTIFEVLYDVEGLNRVLADKPFLTNADGMGLMSVLPFRPSTTMKPKVVGRSINQLEGTLTSGTAQSGLARGPLDATPPTAVSPMKSKSETTAKNFAALPAWVKESLSEESINLAQAPDSETISGTTTLQIPDMNVDPLNGERPQDIQDRFGVTVRVLEQKRPGTEAHSIVISGEDEHVDRYLVHLTRTWRKSA